MIDRRSRVTGGMVGLLVGDALGVPYEFTIRARIPDADLIDMVPPPGFPPTYRVDAGTYSDDGAQALCLAESLLARGCLDPDDFADRLVRWRYEGHLAVGGEVFDIGSTTAAAISRIAVRGSKPAIICGLAGEENAGNGSLMRVLPYALWERNPDLRVLMTGARWTSYVTHRARAAAISCALYCAWVRNELEGRDDAWRLAVADVVEAYATESAEWARAAEDVAMEREPTGSGYSVDTLQGARWVMERARDYEEAVRMAIGLGGDTDTTAAVVGGIAGVRWGIEAIPYRWVLKLRLSEETSGLIGDFIARTR